jgi:hypothetical protein
MSPRFLSSAVLAVAALAGTVPAAQADTLLSAAPGARNLAAGGGYAAWAAPTGDGHWRLMVRDRAGAVTAAPVATFGTAPDPSIGSDAFIGSRMVVVYSRCSGTSAVRGCDVHRLDLASGKESKVSGAATRSYSETAPSIANGRLGFVRRGGARNGVYVLVSSYSDRAPHLNRIDGHIARETSTSHSRIAFLYRNAKGQDDITIAQQDGHNRRLMTRAKPGVLFNVVATRYKVGWLEHATGSVVAKMTDRVNPSDEKPTIRTGKRPLPASTQSAVADSSHIVAYLDAEGYKRLDPAIFPSYG